MDVGAQPPTARLAPRLFAAVKAQRGSRRRWIVAAAVALALVAVTAFAVTKFRTPVNTVAASDTTVLSPTSLRSSVSATGTVASANSFKVYSNLTYAVRYLAGAYRAANGDADRAIRYYAGGYYYVTKRQQRQHAGHHHARRGAVQAGAPLSILPPQ